MITVNVDEAKKRFASLLSKVEHEHENVRICRNGKPVALISGIEKKSCAPFVQDPELAKVVFYEDPAAPLAPEDWPEE